MSGQPLSQSTNATRQIYFCNFIIEPFLKDPVHAKHIDADVLEKYWDVGGVR